MPRVVLLGDMAVKFIRAAGVYYLSVIVFVQQRGASIGFRASQKRRTQR
jgi:hypothetical protein